LNGILNELIQFITQLNQYKPKKEAKLRNKK